MDLERQQRVGHLQLVSGNDCRRFDPNPIQQRAVGTAEIDQLKAGRLPLNGGVKP